MVVFTLSGTPVGYPGAVFVRTVVSWGSRHSEHVLGGGWFGAGNHGRSLGLAISMGRSLVQFGVGGRPSSPALNIHPPRPIGRNSPRQP